MKGIPQLTAVGGYWTTSWRDSSGKRRWRRFGSVKNVSRDEAARKFNEFLREWLTVPLAGEPVEGGTLTVGHLAELMLRRARTYYRKPSGRPTGEAENVKDALAPVTKLFGRKLASEFTPADLIRCREEMIKTCARGTANAMVNRIRRVFRWGVEEGLVLAGVWHGLTAVVPLKRGRTEARETEPVQSVLLIYVAMVFAAASSVLGAMAHLQLLTGMRPGEVCAMRCGDIDMRDDVWVYAPREHKTEHHGRLRKVFLGLRAKRILAPFMDRPKEAFLFSPRDAIAERCAGCETHRRTSNTDRLTDRKVRDHYDAQTYRESVARICRKLEIPAWTPGRLRHNRATATYVSEGVQGAQVMLGHSDSKTTLRYVDKREIAAREDQEGRRLAKEIG